MKDALFPGGCLRSVAIAVLLFAIVANGLGAAGWTTPPPTTTVTLGTNISVAVNAPALSSTSVTFLILWSKAPGANWEGRVCGTGTSGSAISGTMGYVLSVAGTWQWDIRTSLTPPSGSTLTGTSYGTATASVVIPSITNITTAQGSAAIRPGDTFTPRVTATSGTSTALTSIHIYAGPPTSDYSSTTNANAFKSVSTATATVDGNSWTAGADGTTYNLYAWAVTGSPKAYSDVYGPVTFTVQGVNGATLVSQSVPTTAWPGQTLAISQTWKNSGSKTWTTAKNYRIGAQNPQDNSTWGGGRFASSGTVAPGATQTYTWEITAPTTVGTYNFQTRWVQESVEWFGGYSTNVQVIVAKRTQAIAFSSLPTRKYGASFSLVAAADSGLPVSFAVTSVPAGIATLSNGNIVTLKGTGRVKVVASQAGNAVWNAAGDIAQEFDVVKADQTINFPNPGDHNCSGAPFTLSATASSGLPVAFVLVSGPVALSGSTVTMRVDGIGSVGVLATQPGDSNYNAAPNSLQQTFQVLDDIPPAKPTGLLPTNLTSRSFVLNWDRPYDNDAVRGVTKYEVYLDGNKLATTDQLKLTVDGLVSLQTYKMRVRAFDSAGNSSVSDELSVKVPDLDPPSLVEELAVTVTKITSHGFTITWKASTDNVAVAGYQFMVNSTLIDLPDGTATSYDVTGLDSGVQYSVNARAYDTSNNVSMSWSDTVQATTLDDVPPSAPVGLEVDGVPTGTSLRLKWVKPYDNVGVTAYEIRWGGGLSKIETAAGTEITGLSSGVKYTIAVRAMDAVGLMSEPSVIDVTTKDTVAPSSPGDVTGILNTTGTSFTVTWKAATDNVGVSLYEVLRDGQSQGTTSALSLPISGLAQGKTYSVTVRARDAAGNWSDPSVPLPVRTPDVEAPGTPQFPAASEISRSGFLLSWAPSSDNIGVVAYQVMLNGTILSSETTTASMGISRLAPATTYTVKVRARDADNNTSPWSDPLDVSTTGSTDDGGALPATWPNKTDSSDTHAIGTTSGQLSVDKSGALTYSIPIWVTPGTAGMQPQLALNYSSQAGAGVAGFGWSLGGISAITRGPQTRAVDGKVHGVDYTVEDRYYLDGQRLIAIQGSDGADQTVYRTEIDSISKIVSYGSTGGGPQYFKVWTKAGLIIEFGNTSDSAAEAQGRSAIVTWGVNRISDTVGNYMTFAYTEDNVAGEQRLDRINYTGSASRLPYASVRLVYENRSDSFSGYMAGAKISRTKRLKSIASYYGETAVRTYSLNYMERTTAVARSLLASITEKGAGGETYPDLVFDYETPVGGWTTGPALVPTFQLAEKDLNTGAGIMDLNGDGYPDLIHKRKDNTTVDYNEAYLNTVNGWTATPTASLPDYRLPSIYTLAWEERVDAGSRFVDMDGDGLPDILFSCLDKSGSVPSYALHNTGAGWEDLTSTAALPGVYIAGYKVPDTGRRFVDVNGDGLQDLVWNTGSGDKGCLINNAHGQFLSGGAFWVRADQWAPPFEIMKEVTCGAQFFDVNGDGLPDMVQFGNTEAAIAINSSTGWAAWQKVGDGNYATAKSSLGALGKYLPPVWLSQDGTGWTATPIGSEIVDLNGDGLPDVIMSNPKLGSAGTAAAYLNTGDGWVAASSYAPPADVALLGRTDGSETDATGAAVIDLNGDGLPDLAVNRASESAYYYLNTGRGWGQRNASYLSGVDFNLPDFLVNADRTIPTGTQFADFNADGIADSISNFGGVSFNKARPTTDRLVKVTNGLGVAASVTYAVLTERDAQGKPTVYTKGSGAVYPAVDVIAPMLVVKTVNNDDGVGGQYPVNYTYGGLRSDYLRGSLGFEWMRTTDGRTGMQSTTWFRQDYPYVGLPKSSETKTSATGKTLSLTTTTYATKALNGGKTMLPYAESVVQLSYELDGTFVSGAETTTELNAYGNATMVTVASLDSTLEPDGYSKTTTSYFADNPDTWILGRLTSSYVTAAAPEQTSLTRSSAFEYDPDTGLLTKETIEPNRAALRQVTTYTYDTFGNKHTVTISGTGVTDRTTTTTYDSAGRFPESSANALGHVETYVYDQNLGVLKSLTGPNLLTTAWDYDGFGAKIKETRSDSTTTTIAVKWTGSAAPARAKYFVETTATGAAPSLAFYDAFGRAIQSVALNGAGEIVYQDTVYDLMGRAKATSVPYRSGGTVYWTQTSSYDLLNRPLTVLTPGDMPGSAVMTTSFAYKGLTTEVTDARGRIARTTKNSQGWVVSALRDAGGIDAKVEYEYDPFGNLITTTAAGVVTTLEYDLRGRKTAMSDPDMGTWTYQYNAFGELVSQTDAKQQTTTMAYDDLGRLKTRVEPETDGTTRWTYDTAPRGSSAWLGKLASVSAPGGYVESYTYDAQGRTLTVARTIDGTAYTVGQTYDAVGRPERTNYPLNGFQTRNVYNAFGFVKEVRRSDGTHNDLYWHADTYAVDGRVNGDTLGNGLTGDRYYSDSSGRLMGAAVGLAPYSDIQFLTYTYDQVGNVLSRNNQAGSESRQETFVYDTLDRLKSHALSGGATVTVTYDIAGNIVTKSDVGTYSYGTNPLVRPHAVSGVSGGPLGTQAYAYDANGNMTSGYGRTLTWTSFNQARRIEQGAHYSEFKFGAAHERVLQTTDRGSTVYVGSLFELVKNPDGTATEEKNYIFAPTGRVAVVRFGTIASSAGEVNYFHTDGLGSITAVTDGMGNVLQRFAFDPWGKRLSVSLTTGATTGVTPANNGRVTRGYTDHEHLDDFGLIHMNGRVYDPVLGRFLSADPFVGDVGDSQDYNRYSYVGNNPMNATDPSGYFKLGDALKIVAAVVVGVVTAGVAMYAYAAMMGATFTGGLVGAISSVGLAAGWGGGWAIAAGAGFGFGSAFTSSLLNGGSIGDAFKAGVIGGVVGGISAGIAGKIGDFAEGHEWFQGFGQNAAHGVTQGALTEATGGQFRHGFYAGFASSALAGPVSSLAPGGRVGETAAAAVIGGTASALGGGKFANGAVSAAFVYMFNHSAHASGEKSGKGFWSSLWDEVNPMNLQGAFARQALSMTDSMGGMMGVAWGHMTGNDNMIAAGWDQIGGAYGDSAFGQTENGPWWAYYGTRAGWGVAAAGTAAVSWIGGGELLASRGFYQMSNSVVRNVGPNGARYWSEAMGRQTFAAGRGMVNSGVGWKNALTTVRYQFGNGEIVRNFFTNKIVHYLPY